MANKKSKLQIATFVVNLVSCVLVLFGVIMIARIARNSATTEPSMGRLPSNVQSNDSQRRPSGDLQGSAIPGIPPGNASKGRANIGLPGNSISASKDDQANRSVGNICAIHSPMLMSGILELEKEGKGLTASQAAKMIVLVKTEQSRNRRLPDLIRYSEVLLRKTLSEEQLAFLSKQSRDRSGNVDGQPAGGANGLDPDRVKKVYEKINALAGTPLDNDLMEFKMKSISGVIPPYDLLWKLNSLWEKLAADPKLKLSSLQAKALLPLYHKLFQQSVPIEETNKIIGILSKEQKALIMKMKANGTSLRGSPAEVIQLLQKKYKGKIKPNKIAEFKDSSFEYLDSQLEGRDEWQKPEKVMQSMGLRENDRIADVGCGSGYFTVYFSKKVGPRGHVYATDMGAIPFRRPWVAWVNIQSKRSVSDRGSQKSA